MAFFFFFAPRTLATAAAIRRRVLTARCALALRFRFAVASAMRLSLLCCSFLLGSSWAIDRPVTPINLSSNAPFGMLCPFTQNCVRERVTLIVRANAVIEAGFPGFGFRAFARIHRRRGVVIIGAGNLQ